MFKLNSQKHKKIIQKILNNLLKNKYFTYAVITQTYLLSLLTFKHWSQEHQSQVLEHVQYQLLSFNEKKILENWIWHQCCHECSLIIDMLQNIIITILKSQNTAKVLYIESHWSQIFLNWHSKLKHKRIRSLCQQWFLEILWSVIQEWFSEFMKIVQSHKIKTENMWNMNEKDFAMKLSKSQKIIVTANSFIIFYMKSENHIWVSVLECISSTEIVFISYFVFKEQHHQKNWYRSYCFNDWAFAISLKSWINNELEHLWLKNHFDSLTKSEDISEWCLLLLNSYDSHIMWQFQHHCFMNWILFYVYFSHTIH